MKSSYWLLLLACCLHNSQADFSDTEISVHPLYASAEEPFLLAISGQWPDDCHPGEQKPVITGYTGDSALIEFEIIVEHVTCNSTPTPYRVLVDMSDVVDEVSGEFPLLDVTVRFRGSELVGEVDKSCLLCDPPPPPRDIKPEAGLYYNDGLEKQGLLLARQNQRMGVYPLIYDESGSSEWVFGGGGLVEDVFFTDLYELTGGQCLGCPLPDEPPQMDRVGKLSMLMDSESVIQVKVNDGLFTTYEQIEFGYGSIDAGNTPADRVPDLSGRWAFVDLQIDPALPVPESFELPLVFDIVLESVNPATPAPEATDSNPPAHVIFAMLDIEGNRFAQMRCDYIDIYNRIVNEMTCNLNTPNLDEGTTPFNVELLSLERLKMTYAGLILGFGSRPNGTAVRID